MAQITIDIPAGVTNRVLDAFASEYRYNVDTDGTKASFAKKQIIEFIKRTVRDSEISANLKSSAQIIRADVESGLGLT